MRPYSIPCLTLILLPINMCAIGTATKEKKLISPLVRVEVKKLEKARAAIYQESNEIVPQIDDLKRKYRQIRERRRYIVWLLKRYFGYSHHI